MLGVPSPGDLGEPPVQKHTLNKSIKGPLEEPDPAEVDWVQ